MKKEEKTCLLEGMVIGMLIGAVFMVMVFLMGQIAFAPVCISLGTGWGAAIGACIKKKE